MEHNSTDKTRAEIESMPIVGKIHHNWRQRDITLYSSSEADKLYMIGIAYDRSMVVISRESIGMNESTAMDYWRHGNKVLTRD